MPPWSSRLLPSTSTTNIHQQANTPPNVDGSHHETRPPLSVLQPPTLHPQSGADTSVTRRHGRSFSNPFPSIFGGGSKKDKKHSDKAIDFESTDDEIAGQKGKGHSSPQRNAHGASMATSDKDLLLGKCMTCDSQVRWPRGLKTFRCTICLAVNDLEPYSDPPPTPGPPHRSGEPHSGASIPRKALPLSIEKTRALIERCLNTYLQSRLDDSNPAPRPLNRSPPHSPVFAEPAEVPEGLLDVQPHENYQPPGQAPDPHSMSSNVQVTNPPSRGSSLPKPLPSRSLRENDNPPTGSLSEFPKIPIEQLGRRGSSPMLEVPQRDDIVGLGTRRQDSDAGRRSITGSSPTVFRPLENYIISSFNGSDCVNHSFLLSRPFHPPRATSEGVQSKPATKTVHVAGARAETPVFEIDAKTLLAGDVAENGLWWTGARIEQGKTNPSQKRSRSPEGRSARDLVTLRSPRINWQELAEWYHTVLHAGDDWVENWLELRPPDDRDDLDAKRAAKWDSIRIQDLEQDIAEARIHAQRTLLKATENLLKRPKRPLKHPEEARFLLILLANPLLSSHGPSRPRASSFQTVSRCRSREHLQAGHQNGEMAPSRRQASTAGNRSSGPGHHSGIIKRILGLLSNLPNECHHYLGSWFSRYSDSHFQRTVDLVGSFVTYRLSRQHNRKRSEAHFTAEDLIPSSSVPGAGSHAMLHHALGGGSTSSKATKSDHKIVLYGDDWQLKAAARVMSLLFSANNNNPSRKRDTISPELRHTSAGLNARHQAHIHGQILPISTFYNTLLDYSDLIADFDTWESRRGKFSFCQYPFFLSIWAKIHILEHDARRQMEVRAREAFFDSILSRRAVSQFLVLKVRRDCLVEDSMKSVSAVVGTGQEEIKKGLRIEFVGEEGVDAGGLRKEWFLLLVREVFDPNHGLFAYDDDSQYCYFNPYCFESSEQFFLVGILLGLAIYNSTILDIALPPFAFKKLLASAPSNTNGPSTSTPRIPPGYTIEDLAEFRPALARGLRSLLEFEGNVQETFCRDFVAEVDRYGEIVQVALCPNGQNKPVTNSNRQEFVDLYVQYLLDIAVARQYEPFKRGFFTVCGGNALSLFRPEEIELLVRGSDEPLDIASLRAVAAYERWGSTPDQEDQVVWFWDFFSGASPGDQRKILSFITGSDRIPAMGATNLVIRITCIGDDVDRFPSARTCFNMLALYRYSSRAKLETMLWRAVCDSEGFGLK